MFSREYKYLFCCVVLYYQFLYMSRLLYEIYALYRIILHLITIYSLDIFHCYTFVILKLNAACKRFLLQYS